MGSANTLYGFWAKSHVIPIIFMTSGEILVVGRPYIRFRKHSNTCTSSIPQIDTASLSDRLHVREMGSTLSDPTLWTVAGVVLIFFRGVEQLFLPNRVRYNELGLHPRHWGRQGQMTPTFFSKTLILGSRACRMLGGGRIERGAYGNYPGPRPPLGYRHHRPARKATVRPLP